MMKAIAFIPARFSSTRFPGKPLALLGGKKVVERVCRQVEKAGITPVVATDDARILRAVKDAGYKCFMTSSKHKSGTDRIREALDLLQECQMPDVVLNVQGDEPFIKPQQLESLVNAFEDSTVNIATLVKRFDPERGVESLQDPNVVKVVRDSRGNALYFSRSIIPFVRSIDLKEWVYKTPYFIHLGVYAFRPYVLREITSLPQSEIEKAESLEQLRWLSNGWKIRTIETTGESIGIDTPEDLQNAENILAELKEFD